MRTLFLALIFALPLFSFTTTADGGHRATLAGKTSGEITKADIYKAGELQAPGLKIVSYKLIVVTGERTIVQKFATSAKLSDEMLGLIRKANTGQKLYFEKIVAKNRAGKEFELENLILVLK